MNDVSDEEDENAEPTQVWGPEELEAAYDANLSRIMSRRSKDVKSDPRYKELDVLLRGSNDIGDEGDEDLMTLETAPTTIPKDPFTTREITDPVKNSECGHVYDRAGIEQYISQTRKPR